MSFECAYTRIHTKILNFWNSKDKPEIKASREEKKNTEQISLELWDTALDTRRRSLVFGFEGKSLF